MIAACGVDFPKSCSIISTHELTLTVSLYREASPPPTSRERVLAVHMIYFL